MSENSSFEKRFKLPEILKSNESTPPKRSIRLQKNFYEAQPSFRKYLQDYKFRALLDRKSVLLSELTNKVSISPHSKNLNKLNCDDYVQLSDKIDLLPPIERHQVIEKLKEYPEMLEKLRSLSPSMNRASIQSRPPPRIAKKPPNKFEQMLAEKPARVEVDMSLQIATIKDIVHRVREYECPSKYVPESCRESTIPNDQPFFSQQFKDYVFSGWCNTPDTDATKLSDDDSFTHMVSMHRLKKKFKKIKK